MKKLCLFLTMAAASFPIARAAISVGPSGSALITFGTAPTIAEGWSTVANTGASADITTAAGLSAAVATNSPNRFTVPIPTTAVVNPIIAQTTVAYNTINQNLQSVATGPAYIALLATLQNDSGAQLNTIFISYELGEQHAAGSTVTEEVPGFHVYFSLIGAPGSWQEIPGLAGDTLLGTRSSIVNLGGTWPPGAQLFIIWADDNANANRDNVGPEEGGYTIDNFLVSPNGPPPNSITVVGPTNGSTFPQGVPIVVSAAPIMSKPITNVAFFRDGILIGNDTNSPYSVVYSNAALGSHTLTATAKDDTGASVSSSNFVQINVVSNMPPTITLVNPTSGQNFFVGQNITNQTTVSDSDGVVVSVEFYVDGTLRYIDTSPPFRFELCNALSGPHSIGAIAVDNGGARGSNSVMITVANPTGFTILVPNGSNWKYLDDGSDQGGFWSSPAFNDSNWANGVAELGYGDITDDRPERTQVGFGGNPNLRFATTYFRKTFNVNNPSSFTSLLLRVLRDDTAIVYLNGNQIYSDTTNAVVDFSTYAGPAAADDGTVYQVSNIPLALLVPGQNLLAVEIHQSATNSSDLSFDAMLWGGLPFLRISLDPSNAANVKLDWAPANWHLQSSPSVSTPGWSDFAGAAPPLLLPAPNGPLFFRTISPDGTMCSPNVVGAVPLKLFPNNNLIANPLIGTNNHLNTILPLASDGSQDGVTISRFNAASQSFDQPIQWFAGAGWVSGDPTESYIFNPGEGFSLQNPLQDFLNVLMVGDVPQGMLTNRVPSFKSLRSSQVPQTAPLANVLGFPPKDGDAVTLLDPATQNLTVYQYMFGGWTPGSPQGPTIPVGTSFFFQMIGAPFNWGQTFSIACGGGGSTPPVITQQPLPQTVLAGNSAVFSVSVTGSPPISFQWFFGNKPIPGATGSTYTVASAQLSNAGPYYVHITNAAAGLDSSNALLNVYGPIVINEWMPVNGGVTLDPADGKPDDWFELYNASASAISLAGFHLSDKLSNPNTFTIQPGVVIPPNGYLMFWADNQPAQGPLHVNFGLPAAGGEIGLFAPGGQLMDAISYVQGATNVSQGRQPDGDTKIVTLVAPTPNSSNAGGPPVIAVQPSNQTTTCFGTVTFVAGVAGSLPATYQWVHNGCDVVPGADSPTLTLKNVNRASGGNYSLVISNALGRVASDDVSLGIITSPVPQLTWTNGMISWPLGCPDFFIEQAPDFSSSVWASAGPVTQNGSNYSVTVPFGTNTSNSVFYRLRGLNTAPITTQPIGRAAKLQETVQLSVGTAGAPSAFQWRHNGRVVPDQTNSTMFLNVASNSNYGAYEAIVFADGMAYFSTPAFIRPAGSQTFLSDDFAGREIFTNQSSTIHGTTAGATHEPGEPQHADVPGGKSVWLSWLPPASGIATFDTLGSGFDTALAVYRVNPAGPIDLVASDDDGGGFLWSKVSFNAKAGTEYAIALDGAAGTSGFFVLSWGLEVTSNAVPIITTQPQQIVVTSNQPALFSVTVTSPPPFLNVTYQWFRNNTPIPGATAAQFSIGSVKPLDAEDYFVVVNNGVRAVESRHALLQVSSDPADFHAEHKTLVDFVCGVPTSPISPDAAPKAQSKVIAPSSSGSLNTSATPYNPPTGLAVCCLPSSMSPTYYTLVTVTTGGTCPVGRTSDLTFSISGMSSIAALTVFENSVLSIPAKACATTINPTVTVAAKRNTSYSAVIVTSCSGACFSISYTNSPCR